MTTQPEDQIEHIYLAGPMSGYPDHNKAEFMKWADRLEETGAVVFNPITSPQSQVAQKGLLGTQEAYRMCLKTDLNWICEKATTVFFLKGWERSLGARAEHATATALGLHIHYES